VVEEPDMCGSSLHGNGEVPRRTAADGRPGTNRGACNRVRSTLGWQPRFNDLQTIVAHALAWERKLSKRAGGNQSVAGFSQPIRFSASTQRSPRSPNLSQRLQRSYLRFLC
jgi:hypothetical protein